MRRANYIVVEETPEMLRIQDVGPWDTYLSVTNAAEGVVEELAPVLNGRRLEYIDSSGDLDELIVVDGCFKGFKPCTT